MANAMRRNRNLQQSTVRGLAKVKAVVLWYVLVHNVLRGWLPCAPREPDG